MDYKLKAKELIGVLGFSVALKYAFEKTLYFKSKGHTLTARTNLLFWENVILNIADRN